MKIKLLLSAFLYSFLLCQISKAQVSKKFNYGFTASLQISDPKYYDLYDPYPYNRIKRPGGDIYGETFQTDNFAVGAFVQHAVFSNKINVTVGLLYNQKGYKEKSSQLVSQPAVYQATFRKDYLDIPVSVSYSFFKKAENSLFVSTGLYQSFILSGKTVFPNPATPGLKPYEQRLYLANDREVNLTGFSFGTGYRYHFLEAQLQYKNDHHYEYALVTVSYYLH
ncbi:MAG: porin family protein [Mucilaginibacter sp.]|uniref:porin family protein n=1 Tax=Mucilaginibacter sp. TaxID=1882438 RepID=UPI0034E4D5B8